MEYLINELCEYGGLAIAQSPQGVLFLDRLDQFEGVGVAHLLLKVDTLHRAFVEQVHEHVAQGDKVVPAASLLELELVQASENQISLESLNLTLLDVLVSLAIDVAAAEPEVHHVER